MDFSEPQGPTPKLRPSLRSGRDQVYPFIAESCSQIPVGQAACHFTFTNAIIQAREGRNDDNHKFGAGPAGY